MADSAVVAALAGAAGVVAGSAVSSVGVVLRERMINQREREAQQMLRAQRLADERAAFQRDAVLALERAGLDYVNAYAKILAKGL